MRIPTPSRNNPLVSMGPCPEILLEDRTIRFRKPYPRMAMVAHGPPAIYVFHAPERAGGEPVEKGVVKKFERFNNRKTRVARTVQLELSGWKPLGRCKGEVYMSDKEGFGANQEYVHEHERARPTCYINKDENVYVITGGGFRIDEWIEG